MDLNRIFDLIYGDDQLEFIFCGNEEAKTINKVIEDTDSSFDDFINDFLDNDKIKINIKVSKININGKLSIYNFKNFSKFLCDLSINDICIKFTELFQQCCERIQFVLLETEEQFITKSIAFSNSDIHMIDQYNRTQYLKKCDEASVFLEKNRIRLVPYDFYFEENPILQFIEISNLFKKLRNILSYIYIANISNVINNQLVLQFNPSEKGYEYKLNRESKAFNNDIVYEIFNWIYKYDNCIERANVARSIINLYCHSSDDILNLNEKVLNSIKSNYIIYQKKHVEKYIEMKNKISEFITNSSEKIFEISHDVSDALRNNFIAVIVFIMTGLLKDYIDFSKLEDNKISGNAIIICIVFIFAMILYRYATFYMADMKWEWIQNAYDTLKCNYENLFDQKDIEEAFNKDYTIKKSKEQYKLIKGKINIVWNFLIIIMILFAAYLIWNNF